MGWLFTTRAVWLERFCPPRSSARRGCARAGKWKLSRRRSRSPRWRRDPDAIWRMAREHLAVLPNAEVDPAAVAVAARVLRGHCQATARCGPPGELSHAWRMPPLAQPRRPPFACTVCPALPSSIPAWMVGWVGQRRCGARSARSLPLVGRLARSSSPSWRPWPRFGSQGGARALREEQAQPYVAVYMEPSAATLQIIDLVVRNLGRGVPWTCAMRLRLGRACLRGGLVGARQEGQGR
jgi:hypothetical protein